MSYKNPRIKIAPGSELLIENVPGYEKGMYFSEIHIDGFTAVIKARGLNNAGGDIGSPTYSGTAVSVGDKPNYGVWDRITNDATSTSGIRVMVER